MGERRFGFEMLAVFGRALDLVEGVDRLGGGFRGITSGMGIQAFDAAASVALNVAESTGRTGARDRARFIDIANGSAREVAAVVCIADRLGVGSAPDRAALRSTLVELIAMVTTMARRQRTRPRPSTPT